MQNGDVRFRYNAFLSYSHTADHRFATDFQAGLQGIARPWWRRRTMRVFRDTTDLSASPDLWEDIRANLLASEHFILLASPKAAASKWVRQEVGLWLAERPRQTLLIVCCEGSIEWNGQRGDFDWTKTDCLPPELKGAFKSEPLWVKAYAPTGERLRKGSSDFVEAVASVAGRILGKPKSDLIGEDLKVHRRNLLTAWAVAVSLATLLSLWLLQGQELRRSAGQLGESNRQLTNTVVNLRVANQEATNANVKLRSETDQRIRDQILFSNRRAQNDFKNDHLPNALAWAVDALNQSTNVFRDTERTQAVTLAAMRVEGMLGQFPELEKVILPGGPIREAQLDAKGERVALLYRKTAQGGGDTIRLWNVTNGLPESPEILLPNAGGPSWFALSPTGDRVAAGWFSMQRQTAHLAVYATDTGRLLAGPIVAGGERTFLRFLPGGTNLVTVSSSEGSRPSEQFTSAVVVWDTSTLNSLRGPMRLNGMLIAEPTMTKDGTKLAVSVMNISDDPGANGRSAIFNLETGTEITPTALRGSNNVSSLALPPDGKQLVTVDLGQQVMLRRWTDGEVVGPGTAVGGQATRLSFPDYSAMLMVVAEIPLTQTTVRSEVRLFNSGEGLIPTGMGSVFSHAGKVTAIARRRPTGISRVAVAFGGDDGVARVWDNTRSTPITPPLQHGGALTLVEFSGERLLTASADGALRIWNLNKGQKMGLAWEAPHPEVKLSGPFAAQFPQPRWTQMLDISQDGEFGLQRTKRDTNTMTTLAIVSLETNPVPKVKWETSLKVDAGMISPDRKHVLLIAGSMPARALQPRLNPIAAIAPGAPQDTPQNPASIEVWRSTGTRVGESVTVPAEEIEAVFASSGRSFIAYGTVGGRGRVWGFVIGPTQVTRQFEIVLNSGVDYCRLHETSQRLLVLMESAGFQVWDLSGPNPMLFPIDKQAALAVEVAFTPDGQTVIGGQMDGNLAAWEANTGKSLGATRQGTDKITALNFSRDGSWLAIGSGSLRRGTLRIYPWKRGQNLTELNATARLIDLPSEVLSIAFSPDGSRVAASRRDGKVDVWECETATVLLSEPSMPVWFTGTIGERVWFTTHADTLFLRTMRHFIRWEIPNGRTPMDTLRNNGELVTNTRVEVGDVNRLVLPDEGRLVAALGQRQANDPMPWEILGRQLVAHKEYATAIINLNHALQLTPTNQHASLLRARATAYSELGKKENSIEDRVAANKLQPGSLQNTLELAKELSEHSPANAIEVLDEAILQNSTNSEFTIQNLIGHAHGLKAVASAQIGRWQDAITAHQKFSSSLAGKAVEMLSPDIAADAHGRLVLYHFGAGDYEGYRAESAKLTARLQKQRTVETAAQIVRAVAVRPGMLSDYAELVEALRPVGSSRVTKIKTAEVLAQRQTLGLALIRQAGLPSTSVPERQRLLAEAIGETQSAISAIQQDPPQDLREPEVHLARMRQMLGLARALGGNKADASQHHREAQKFLTTAKADPKRWAQLYWSTRLRMEEMDREIIALMAPPSALPTPTGSAK